MSKYIDADRLIIHLSDWRFGDNLKAFPCNELIEAIERSPSADVVEVVRCKDCNKSVCIGERYFCDIQYDEWGQPYVVKPDGYCDCGERKEANE